MTRTRVNAGCFNIPGVSAGVVMRGDSVLFLSGHIGTNDDGSVPATLGAQLERAFANLAGTLDSAGAAFANVGRLTIYVRDYAPSMLDDIRRIRDRFVDGDCPPASALIGVSALAFPGLLVEVDAFAML
ncbi:RidA family protein [Salmonella enterica subsp. enterica serovar Virchow]|nr:RidA family protein [Salmonella enterica subsp. enterica serovar Virchow]